MRTISLPALRRLVVAAQGYRPRTRRVDAEEVDSAIRRASCIQLDTISTVERSRVALATRAGVYAPGTVPQLLREGRIIEYWVHALRLLPGRGLAPLRQIRPRYQKGPGNRAFFLASRDRCG